MTENVAATVGLPTPADNPSTLTQAVRKAAGKKKKDKPVKENGRMNWDAHPEWVVFLLEQKKADSLESKAATGRDEIFIELGVGRNVIPYYDRAGATAVDNHLIPSFNIQEAPADGTEDLVSSDLKRSNQRDENAVSHLSALSETPWRGLYLSFGDLIDVPH
ncbi:hypothetical protein R1flu_007719 [Riccia fluitans]|uniref:Uncharacterized protein n=1 Tax=Riccia fluitans TaxID=41844 RepID=A0ABD1YZX5_9MARC